MLDAFELRTLGGMRGRRVCSISDSVSSLSLDELSNEGLLQIFFSTLMSWNAVSVLPSATVKMGEESTAR